MQTITLDSQGFFISEREDIDWSKINLPPFYKDGNRLGKRKARIAYKEHKAEQARKRLADAATKHLDMQIQDSLFGRMCEPARSYYPYGAPIQPLGISPFGVVAITAE